MAESESGRAPKRKHEANDVNWKSEEELEQMREKKLRLEAQEPYNSSEARHLAKEAGKEEAMSSGWSEVPTVSQDMPRGLSIDGDSSSEFVSAVEESTPDAEGGEQAIEEEHTQLVEQQPIQEPEHDDSDEDLVAVTAPTTPIVTRAPRLSEEQREQRKFEKKRRRREEVAHKKATAAQASDMANVETAEDGQPHSIEQQKSKRAMRRSRAARRRRELLAVTAAMVAVIACEV